MTQECRNDLLKRQAEAKQARYGVAPNRNGGANDQENEDSARDPAKNSRLNGPKRDFFGRIVANNESRPDQIPSENNAMNNKTMRDDSASQREKAAWISYHEGFSNAVRKRISMSELLLGL